jgi:Tfp pilus assembly protein FimT
MLEHRAQHGFSGEKGASLVELVFVVAISLVLSAVAIINIASSLKVAAADSAAQLVQQDMRMARQGAISNRLVYLLTFSAPNSIIMQQQVATLVTVNGATVPGYTYNPVSTDSIPSTVSFQILSGAPIDQDGFGSGTLAIDFNSGNTIYFYPDGAGRDANQKICNGVVYTGISGDMTSARSVTVWGSTGQIKLYKLYSNATAGYYWQ